MQLTQNSAAFNFLEQFFSQKKFPALILKGEKSSGKSHLLQIFATKYDAQLWQNLADEKVNPTQVFQPNHFYIIEDIEDFKDEKLLLNLINSAAENKAFLVLSAKKLPRFSLPDLNSRIRNIVNCEIENPDLESIKILLIERFSRLQIKPSDAIIDYIANNINRSYEAVDLIVRSFELESAKNAKNLSLNDVKKLFV